MLGFRNCLCKLNRRPPRFRTVNRQTLGFRVHERKLNRQTLGARNFRTEQFKAHKYLATRSQCDMNQRAKFKPHLAELQSHTKFSKLNQSLRLGFRMSELKAMIESGNKVTRHHRPTGNRNQGAVTVHQHPPVDVEDLRSRSPESSGGHRKHQRMTSKRRKYHSITAPTSTRSQHRY